MLGLSYRQVSAGARQAATQKRSPAAAVNQALEAKIAAIRTLAPFVDFLPAAQTPPPVVGMDQLEAHVRQIKTVLEHPELGVSPGSGILLAGPPGTGKSSFIAWMSWYTNLPVMVFSFANMMKSLVGESETNLRKAILAATAMGAVIVMLDEIEKQAPNLVGAASDGGLGSRMLSMVLTWMQEAWEAAQPVLFVGTANTTALGHLPPEFFSRFPAIFLVDEPDPGTLAEIFRAHLGRIAPDGQYDVEELAARLSQVMAGQRKPVGRDVVQVIRQAQGRAAVERLSGVPGMEDLRAAIQSLREGLRDIGGGVMAKPIRTQRSLSSDPSGGVISLEG
jgi:SpoVK/Ycf46/Vps4 family AAA+-type ATPase